ncbi:hypothetical protein Tco_1466968 [Tanacetum coccineum]
MRASLTAFEGYSDADWNSLSDDSEATSGYIFSIADGVVSWKFKKQTILSQSSMKSEIIVLATASEEAIWLRCLLAKTPLWEKLIPAVLIHCDSNAAIAKVDSQLAQLRAVPRMSYIERPSPRLNPDFIWYRLLFHFATTILRRFNSAMTNTMSTDEVSGVVVADINKPFCFEDDKSVEAQYHEIQKVAHEIISEGMSLDEQFQVAVIIDKLPPSWKDFKNVLRHKTKEFSLETMITRLRVEEEARK